jgi:hypothetical protein
MQTLRLPAVVLRDLRAISSGLHPGRRPTPSQLTAAIWKTASPLPNPLRPTLAVGLLSTAQRVGMKGPPGLSNSPVPTSAVGPRPAASCPQPGRCPSLGAGLLQAAPLRELRRAGPRGAGAVQQVCRRQTARVVVWKPAPFAAQVPDTPHGQARRSANLQAASDTLSFGRRPQLCQRAPRSGERDGGQTIMRPVANCGAFTEPCVAVQYAASSVVAG